MASSIWKFITGYVRIKLEGLKLDTFTNDAISQGVRFDDLRRQSHSRMTASVSYGQLKDLRHMARNRALRITVQQQRGVPVLARRAAGRPGFLAGAMLCLLALMAVNLFVLDVRVVGDQADARLLASVQAKAAELGIVPGARKATLDVERLSDQLMLEVDGLSFASVYVRGVRATVEVVPAAAIPELLDRQIPCDIISTRDGVVHAVNVYEGEALVKPGDVVRRGDVLVSGHVAAADGTVRTVHARADVLCTVWYEGVAQARIRSVQLRPVGPQAQRRAIHYADYVIELGEVTQSPYALSIETTTRTYLLGAAMKGPVLVTTLWQQVQTVEQHADLAQACVLAEQRARLAAYSRMPQGVQVEAWNVSYLSGNGQLRARVVAQTLEQAGLPRAIQ